MSEHKILISSNDYPESVLRTLQEHFTVVQSRFCNFGEEGEQQNPAELLALVPGCAALVWISDLPITTELLDKAGPNLKIVATTSAGFDHCNVPELKRRNIKLTNTPGVLAAAVAEVAVLLMLATARRVTENIALVHRGQKSVGFASGLGIDLRGSTVGIVGLGGIGQSVVKKLKVFDVATFLYTGHRQKPEGTALGAIFVSLEELLRRSDFIVLCVPLTDETRHIINQNTISKMKKNAIVINVGRGDLVDQEALYTSLKNKDILAAGLDVTSPEPLPKDHKLLTLPNIFILPHIGSATVATRREMAELAANNVINYLQDKPLLTPVQI